MKNEELAKYFDHTLLSPTATSEQFEELIHQANTYKFASVCIPSSWIPWVKLKLDSDIPICTVIGFPLGYNSSEAKVFEASHAIKAGAKEIDMVINNSFLKSHRNSEVISEINKIKEACQDNILKVIVETAYHNGDEIIELCKLINQTQADFFKTSTGFANSGAKLNQIKLIRDNLHVSKKIKASGGIRSLDDALAFIEEGVDRIGASASHEIMHKFS